MALSAIVERPLIGVEAQRVFLDLRDHAATYDLIQDVVRSPTRFTSGKAPAIWSPGVLLSCATAAPSRRSTRCSRSRARSGRRPGSARC